MDCGRLSEDFYRPAFRIGLGPGRFLRHGRWTPIVGPLIVANWWNCGQPNREYRLLHVPQRLSEIVGKCAESPNRRLCIHHDNRWISAGHLGARGVRDTAITFRLYRNGVEMAVALSAGFEQIVPKTPIAYRQLLGRASPASQKEKRWCGRGTGNSTKSPFSNHALSPEQVGSRRTAEILGHND